MSLVYISDTNIWIDFRNAGLLRPLLTGDGKLRRQAQRDGLQVYGALWLLDSMVMAGVIPPVLAANALENMLGHGARLPTAECDARLSAWRKP